MLIINPSNDEWKVAFSRALLNGPPFSGKTTSLLTFPRPVHVIAAPGELGHSSILHDPKNGIHLYYWKFDLASPAIGWAQAWQEFKRLCADVIAEKYGPVTTLAIDGLHKLYYVIQKAHGYTQDTDGKAFSEYHEVFNNQMATLLGSSLPYVVATVYDGPEPVEAGSKVTQIFPQLPGRMSKDVMGLFPCVFHAEMQCGAEGSKTFRWLLQPSYKMRAAGLHIPQILRDKFPSELPQDWAEVEKIIKSIASGGVGEVATNNQRKEKL